MRFLVASPLHGYRSGLGITALLPHRTPGKLTFSDTAESSSLQQTARASQPYSDHLVEPRAGRVSQV